MKMIVIDLDGTLLNSKRMVSESSEKYLNELKNNGYIIVIATGRMLTSALKATNGASFANYIISDTGACIYDTIDKKFIIKNFISKDIINKIFTNVNNFSYINICSKDVIFRYSLEDIYDKDYIVNKCDEVTHITLSFDNNETTISVYNEMLNSFNDVEVIIMQDSFSDKKCIEVLANESSKFNGIKKLSDYLNINVKDIIAFGDGLNDIDMVKNSGYGVALKNALEEVKLVSDDITEFDNDHDGVVNYLKEFIK